MKLPSPHLAENFIVADADYYEAKARSCYRLANKSSDDAAKVTLASLGHAFEEKAWLLRDEDS